MSESALNIDVMVASVVRTRANRLDKRAAFKASQSANKTKTKSTTARKKKPIDLSKLSPAAVEKLIAEMKGAINAEVQA